MPMPFLPRLFGLFPGKIAIKLKNLNLRRLRDMAERKMGIIINGVTGRMGTNQHLIRSILAIREQGGLDLGNGDCLMPEPVLMGRNAEKLKALSEAHGALPYSTDLDEQLADGNNEIYFDSQVTSLRYECVLKAIEAGKHIYCEKPSADTSAQAMELYQKAEAAGVKHGVVQDKLWLPGILKLRGLIESGALGDVFAVRGEFGYWVFDGEKRTAQRPSWNYRKEDGGGIIIDMLPHWHYVITNLFGQIESLSCLGARHIKRRWDENNEPYESTAEDAAYATFLTDKGTVCTFNSSWCVRVRRDDLLIIQADGTKGSAVAGLRDCVVQYDGDTPRPVWNPDVRNPIDFRDGWQGVSEDEIFENAFKAEWELFLKHVAVDAPFRWTLKEGAQGVQLAELGHESWQNRAWVDVPGIK